MLCLFWLGAANGLDSTTEGRRISAPKPALLWTIGVAGCISAGVTMWLALNSGWPEAGLQGALSVWISLPYIVGGLIAWWRRPDNRFGLLMLVAGWATFITTFSYSTEDGLYTLGQLFDLLPVAIILHVFLAYPTGRLDHRPERIVVAAAYVASVGFQIPKLLLGGSGPDNLLEVSTRPETAANLEQVQLWALVALLVAGVAVLLFRSGQRGRSARRPIALLADSYVLALAMLAVMLFVAIHGWQSFETIHRITFVALGLAPAVFLTGLLSVRLARSDVADLFVELDANPASADLRDALARALHDPSLVLAYPLPASDAWVDVEGRALEVPSPDLGRATTLIERRGDRIAALLHDASLNDEPELLDAVGAAGGIALENARLQAELRAQIKELSESRTRVIEAEQRERRRLERNLHDGAQQRLIAISLELGQIANDVEADPETHARLETARGEIAISLEELRDLARGLHPAIVTGHGLGVALESLATRASLPVELTSEIDGDRFQEGLEVAAYYVVAESLANIGKHAEASAATVGVARSNGSLVIEVVDDGVGGADATGSGLRGLADRVEALDGTFAVSGSGDGGTTITARFPCD
jgi:signal transduction histidine kinase